MLKNWHYLFFFIFETTRTARNGEEKKNLLFSLKSHKKAQKKETTLTKAFSSIPMWRDQQSVRFETVVAVSVFILICLGRCVRCVCFQTKREQEEERARERQSERNTQSNASVLNAFVWVREPTDNRTKSNQRDASRSLTRCCIGGHRVCVFVLVKRVCLPISTHEPDARRTMNKPNRKQYTKSTGNENTNKRTNERYTQTCNALGIT